MDPDDYEGSWCSEKPTFPPTFLEDIGYVDNAAGSELGLVATGKGGRRQLRPGCREPMAF